MDVFKTSNGKILTCKPPDMHSFDEFSLVFWMKQLNFGGTYNILEITKTIFIFTIATTMSTGFINYSNLDASTANTAT